MRIWNGGSEVSVEYRIGRLQRTSSFRATQTKRTIRGKVEEAAEEVEEEEEKEEEREEKEEKEEGDDKLRHPQKRERKRYSFLVYRETQHNSVTHRENLRDSEHTFSDTQGVTSKFLQSAGKLWN